ncbi:hypothetical protein MKW98_006478 [Papaver atlanticum]|uniref:RRM domain-containing protein n=1 Tax=Papaver atlanticum TaxID=357466 RepID=A0AAD4SFS8_9MAGN|nr:hypothetical protein MKW98_006478 [Papaver atlanticum]
MVWTRSEALKQKSKSIQTTEKEELNESQGKIKVKATRFGILGEIQHPKSPKTPPRKTRSTKTRSTRGARQLTGLPVAKGFFETVEKKKELKESPVSKNPETKVLGTVSSPGEGKTKLIITSSEKRAREGKLPDGSKGRKTGCTILVKNLDPKKMDKDKLFNLFSIYGVIVRIKPPPGLPDQALVQLGDPLQAERAVQFLKGAKLFGKHVEVSIYKHHSMSPTSDTYSYKNSALNGAMDYSACCSPTKVIRVSNLAPQTTEEKIGSHFEEHGTIISTKLVEENGKIYALVMFETEEQATEALVCKHHTNIDGSLILVTFSQ